MNSNTKKRKRFVRVKVQDYIDYNSTANIAWSALIRWLHTNESLVLNEQTKHNYIAIIKHIENLPYPQKKVFMDKYNI